MTPGLEPCSPHSQCGTLPVKLKPTNVAGAGFEPTSSASNAEMLNRCTIRQFAVRTGVEPVATDRQSACYPYTNEPCNLFRIRTAVTRMKILCPCRLDDQILYSITGRNRTFILSAPGGVSNQLECCYRSVALLLPFHEWFNGCYNYSIFGIVTFTSIYHFLEFWPHHKLLIL